jgi:hypothetical protein
MITEIIIFYLLLYFMLLELKTYADKLRQETRSESPAGIEDRYSFEMPPYIPTKEVQELGRIQIEIQKIAKDQFLRSRVRFL